jgi:glycosyltransferase involved in cell wall biosynthesis
MKILQIKYSLVSGGAERFVVDLSNELSDMGHDVYLSTLRDDSINNNGFYKNEISEKVKYINLKLKKGFRLTNIYHIGKLIKTIKPEVVHCHQNLVNYIFPLSIVFSKIKFFHTTHNDAPKEVNNFIEYWLRKYFFITEKVRAITISKETSKSFAKYYNSNKYTEIYNGRKTPLPSEEFWEVKKIIDNIRSKTKIVFLHIGRFAPQKNQELLINVFNRLINEGKPIALLIIGAGFDSENGNRLKSIASNNIYFLGEKHNVVDYYLNSDAFCLSSIHEGMPITLIEALACGCTPICTPVGGICDTVNNGSTGFLSESISEEDYYNVLNLYLRQKDTINKNSLINYYNSKFSIVKCANQHIQLFEN